jgi:hypothetical protein
MKNPIDNETKKLFEKLDKLLYKITLDYLVDNITVKDGVVKNTGLNMGVLEKIQKEFKQKATPLLNRIRIFIVKSIRKMIIDSAKSMEDFSPDAASKGKEVANLLAKQAVKTITKNISLEKSFFEIKQNVIGMMSRPNGAALKDIRLSLEKKIVEKGLTQTQFLSWTYNIFIQYERAGSNELRKKLRLKYAIYEGGVMDNTRLFCEERNGLVFSEAEILSWSNVDFPEKWDPYNPIIDCGCFNCRHRLNWISTELAHKLRPELAK